MSESSNTAGSQSGSQLVPRRSVFKTIIVKIVLFVLGRSLQSATRHDKTLQAEVESWPQDMVVVFKVAPHTPRMAFAKTGLNRLQYKGTNVSDEEADLLIAFKNLDSAFMMLTAQIGTPRAYVEHRIAVRGDLVYGLSVIRCLNIVERYLFPTFIAQRILRRLPDIPFLKRNGLRLWIFLFGIAFGI
ncbi:MAG: hypothetical protein VB013_13580 [Anaerolineaceae bacterium]|nr:hypothetical protein [Anaerolineaceae bacterium]